jgi:hypothetical protein
MIRARPRGRGKTFLLPEAHFHFLLPGPLYDRREAVAGSPSNTALNTPSKSEITLTSFY